MGYNLEIYYRNASPLVGRTLYPDQRAPIAFIILKAQLESG